MALKEELFKINEWWEKKHVAKELVRDKKRFCFKDIVELMDDKRILSLLGPRRVGKTTLMFQLIDYLISKGTNPRRIFFFSGDDPSLMAFKPLIEKVFYCFFREILIEEPRKEKTYIIIDEIHKIENWHLWLKKFFDMKYNIKFIITASSVAKLKRQQKESLLGRVIELQISPMGFREFLFFNDINFQKLEFKEVFRAEKLEDDLKIKKLFYLYLSVGGLPEWFEVRNVKMWYKRISEDLIKRAVYDDIVDIYKIRNPEKIEQMLYFIAKYQDQTFSSNSIANALKIDNETASQYISYLKESFLLMELKNYALSVEKQIRKNYKYCLNDIALKNSLLKEEPKESDDKLISGILEVVLRLALINFANKNLYRLFYWKNKKEVDVVLDTKKTVLPIEVKFKNQITERDTKSISEFMERFKTKNAIIVTKDLLKKSDNILFIPAHLFLLYTD